MILQFGLQASPKPKYRSGLCGWYSGSLVLDNDTTTGGMTGE
jgi:hypothetical protein